jgi:8-oxo-dGTP diphosphatase
MREVAEETGLHVVVGPLLTVVERIDHDDAGRVRYHYVLLEYVAYADTAATRAADDADEAIWADPHSLAEYELWQTTQDVIALALAAPRSL